MESALPMLLFLGFLIGFGVMILACSYKSREQEREEAPTLEKLALQGVPRFFGIPGQSGIENPVAVVVDESAVRRLERFLHEEMSLVEVFVAEPSAEALHREQAQPGASLLERLEGYVRREHEAATNFVLNPSVESLYATPGALAPAI